MAIQNHNLQALDRPRIWHGSPENTIAARAASPTTSHINATCPDISNDQILISRAAFITTITLCTVITFLSLIIFSITLHREHSRHRQRQAAKSWGRQSRLGHRISMMRKEVDYEFSRQYQGCLMNIQENPEMGSDSPVEMGCERRVWEADGRSIGVPPAPPAAKVERGWRKSRLSLFFDAGVGVWLPRR